MAGIRDRAPRRALRARRLQALALLMVSAAITAIAAAAPLHTRAMAQALTTADLAQAPLATTSLDVTGRPTTDLSSASLDPPAPQALSGLIPASITRHYGAPLVGWSADANNSEFRLDGQIVWREGECDHVVWIKGSCPQAADEIAVSEADLRLPHVVLGATMIVPGTTRRRGAPATVSLHIVGVYRLGAGSFWEARPPTGSSGFPTDTGTAHDDWLTSEATFSDAAPLLVQPISENLYPISPRRTDVDSLATLPGRISRTRAELASNTQGDGVTVETAIGDLAKDVAHQRHQTDKTVPVLMAQALLLGLLVTWQLLGAAAHERRGEAALALLRGRGRVGAASLLVRELLPPVVAGVPLGAIAALLLSWWGRVHYLPYSPPFELVPSFWIALAACVLVLTSLTVAAVTLVAREPVARLLRSVSRIGGIGVWPAVTLAVAGTGAVAFVAGWLGGSGALAGPALLAVVVGLVLSYAVAPLAARAGRWALHRGMIRTALAVTDAARSPGARRLVAMTTVATALLVFAADAVAVGDRNRERAAQEQVGTSQVVTVSGDLASTRAAVTKVDPRGRTATVVAVRQSQGVIGAVATVGVDPAQFRRIANLDATQDDLPWSHLTPPTAPPVRIVGHNIRLAVTADVQADAPLSIDLTLVHPDGGVVTSTLGEVRPSGRSVLHDIEDCDHGCTVTAIGIDSSPGAQVSGNLTLAALAVDGTPVVWGGPSEWRDQKGTTGTIATSEAADGGLALRFDLQGFDRVALPTAWLPLSFPTVISGRPPADAHGSRFNLTGLDGVDRPATVLVRSNRLPGLPYPAAVTDLDTLSRGSQPAPDLVLQVWMRDPSAAFIARVRAALQDSGDPVVSTASISTARAAFDQSATAWSLALAVVVGLTGLIAAVLALIVVAVTSWKGRAHDVASHRMAGLPVRQLRQALVAGQVGAVVVAVAAGTAAGLVGARLALKDFPLLAQAPVGWQVDLGTAWAAVTGAVVVALVVLGIAGWLSARTMASKATLDRLRGMS
ncbi:MAG TPA: FtsX-like permease family protein [Actinomycetes bacterium]|jgi:hypothetical protein